MTDEVKAQYDELEQVSSRFGTQAQAVEELFQNVSSCMEELKDGWIGRGSDAFFAEMEGEIIPALNRLRDALADAGMVTKDIASAFQEAEDEASARFRS